MNRLRDLDLARHLADPGLKRQFVTPMFNLVAPRYDDFTRLFSFGMDATWKADLVRLALAQVTATDGRELLVLDAACGTGDLGLAIANARTDARVIGVDASREMLAFARIRAQRGPDGNRTGAGSRLEFREGDLEGLGVADASADLVAAGYAYRNAAALAPALAEAARVTRPGGILAVLDFYRPPYAPWRAAFLAYLRAAGSGVGWWWHGEPVAYGYIAPSIEAHVSADDFSRRLEAHGFDMLTCRQFLFGGVALHIARRRG